MDPHAREIVAFVFARLAASGYEALNDVQRCLVCVWSASGEIGNGGFEQFLFNTSGDWSADTAVAFRAMGAPVLARIVEKAMDLLPGRRPARDLETRRSQLISLAPSAVEGLSRLSREFHEAEAHLDTLIEAFVREHDRQLRG